MLTGYAAAAQDRILVLGDADDPASLQSLGALDDHLVAHGFPSSRLVIERRQIDREAAAARAAVQKLLSSASYRVVVAANMAVAQTVRHVDARVPLVFTGASDPVELCLAQSLAQPGRGATGETTFGTIAPKMIEALRDAYPQIARIVVLVDGTKEAEGDAASCGAAPLTRFVAAAALRQPPEPCVPGRLHDPEHAAIDELRPMQSYARRMNLELVFHRICRPADLAGLATYAKPSGSTGVLVPYEFLFYQHCDAVIGALGRLRLAAIYARKRFAEHGGLMALSPVSPGHAQMFELVAQVLRGADAGTLPIQVVRRFEFWINLRAARQIGAAPSLRALARAERFIE